MGKKSLAICMALVVLSAGLATSAFAQQQQPLGDQGFFGAFFHFFSRMFNPGQNPGNSQGEENITGTPSGTPSGKPDTTGTENRLQGLVTAGKITQAQEQEILAEITKIQTEIQNWSVSTGLNAGYVYGGLRGPGMDAGIGGGQGENPGGSNQRGGMPNGR